MSAARASPSGGASAAASTRPPDDEEPRIPYEPPTFRWRPGEREPGHYDWREVFPFLRHVLPWADVVRDEVLAVRDWHDWPEEELYARLDREDVDATTATLKHIGAHGRYTPGSTAPAADGSATDPAPDWKIIPFVCTFPADDPSRTVWVDAAAAACPRTARLLRAIPGIRTALVSRLGPNTTLAYHQGWASLANAVLRCHVPLVCPREPHTCGLVVDKDPRFHTPGEMIVFDDSRRHFAFNHSDEDRIVLIFDIARPDGFPPGIASGRDTPELHGFLRQMLGR